MAQILMPTTNDKMSPALRRALDALGSITRDITKQVEKVALLAKQDGYDKREIRTLVFNALKKAGYSKRSAYMHLPAWLKDQTKVANGSSKNFAKQSFAANFAAKEYRFGGKLELAGNKLKIEIQSHVIEAIKDFLNGYVVITIEKRVQSNNQQET